MKVKSESEVVQSCPTLSDPMDCSLLGSSVLGIFQARVLEWVPLPSPHYLLELAQIHVHWFGDAIQSSRSLLSPSPAFSLSQHQDLFPVSWLFASGGQSNVVQQHLCSSLFFSVQCSLSFLPLLITYHLNEILLCHIWLVQGCSPDTCWKHQNPSLRILEIDRGDRFSSRA